MSYIINEDGIERLATEEEIKVIEQDIADSANKNLANKIAQIRAERNTKLIQSDWTQGADSIVDKNIWAIYRQALRDIPNQVGFPYDITWPTEPQ